MRFRAMFAPTRVAVDLPAPDRESVFLALLELVKQDFPDVQIEETVRVLLDRERLGTTAIGQGMAIPHARLDAVDRPCFTVGRSKQGIEFKARDGLATHLFFLLLAPERPHATHLNALARIARILKTPHIFQDLMTAPDDPQALLDEILHRHEQLDASEPED